LLFNNTEKWQISSFKKFQAFWPIYQLQLKRSYILCNWHASGSTFSPYPPYSLFLSGAAIIGHLSFFLYEESPYTQDSSERAAKIYQQLTCDTSFKQAIEKIFELENISNDSCQLCTAI